MEYISEFGQFPLTFLVVLGLPAEQMHPRALVLTNRPDKSEPQNRQLKVTIYSCCPPQQCKLLDRSCVLMFSVGPWSIQCMPLCWILPHSEQTWVKGLWTDKLHRQAGTMFLYFFLSSSLLSEPVYQQSLHGVLGIHLLGLMLLNFCSKSFIPSA